MASHVIRVQYIASGGTIKSYEFSNPKNTSYPNASYKTYVSSVVSDSNGGIDVTLTIKSEDVYGFTFMFENNIFPTEIIINDMKFENSDNQFEVMVYDYTYDATTTIKFSKMNKANVPLIISTIKTGVSIDYTEDEIVSWTRGGQLSTDNELPKYELVGQYGRCSFIDKDNIILTLKILGSLKKPKSMEFLLDGTLIGVYKVNSWEYETSNSIVTVELSDSVEGLKDVKIEPKSQEYYQISYRVGYASVPSYTAYDLFLEIKTKMEEYGEVFEEISSRVVTWLQSVAMAVVKYTAENLSDLVVEFCNLTQLTFYKKQDGKVGVYLWR